MYVIRTYELNVLMNKRIKSEKLGIIIWKWRFFIGGHVAWLKNAAFHHNYCPPRWWGRDVFCMTGLCCHVWCCKRMLRLWMWHFALDLPEWFPCHGRWALSSRLSHIAWRSLSLSVARLSPSWQPSRTCFRNPFGFLFFAVHCGSRHCARNNSLLRYMGRHPCLSLAIPTCRMRIRWLTILPRDKKDSFSWWFFI